jgi:uncharacterized protein YjiS (DUF1127 family)
MSTLLSEPRQPISAPRFLDRLPAHRATPQTSARHDPVATIASHPAATPRGSLSLFVDVIVATLREWRRRSAERRELARLDERIIRDVGLDPSSVYYEASQSFWRVPRDWRN